MGFLVILACVCALAYALRKQIRAYPWAFYCLAVALDVLLFADVAFSLPRELRLPISVLMHKGGLGVAMFVLVMWIGVFPRGGVLSRAFRPIRAELSIMACLLIAGHMAVYASSYIPYIAKGVLPQSNVFAAIVIAFVLLLLVLVLGITSLRAVKRRMKARTWKRVQNFAYLFYGLVLVHLALMLGPAALSGSRVAQESVVVYAIVFGGYIVARVWRAIVDRRERIDLSATVMEQGFKG